MVIVRFLVESAVVRFRGLCTWPGVAVARIRFNKLFFGVCNGSVLCLVGVRKSLLGSDFPAIGIFESGENTFRFLFGIESEAVEAGLLVEIGDKTGDIIGTGIFDGEYVFVEFSLSTFTFTLCLVGVTKVGLGRELEVAESVSLTTGVVH